MHVLVYYLLLKYKPFVTPLSQHSPRPGTCHPPENTDLLINYMDL